MTALFHFGLPKWDSVGEIDWIPDPTDETDRWCCLLDLVVTRIIECSPPPKAYMKIITVAGLDGLPDIVLRSKYNDEETREYHNSINDPSIWNLLSREDLEGLGAELGDNWE